jgi:multisubunit Na+/H+ antiporter MnhE subunit
MASIARAFVMPLVVGAVVLAANAFVVNQDATVRHYVQIGGLALLIVSVVFAVGKVGEIVRERRRRPTMTAIPYRTRTQI